MTTAAIFIDLENFYRGAKKAVDTDFALTLLAKCTEWTKALTKYDKKGGGENKINRSFVIQRVYAGDQIWQEIYDDQNRTTTFSAIDLRAQLSNARYEDIFCAALTGGGKNAADIRMAVEAIRMIINYPSIDEVFVLAQDADFSPLIKEIRRLGSEVFILNIRGTTAEMYLGEAAWLGADTLTPRDFYLLIDDLKYPTGSLRVPADDFDTLKSALQEAANSRQGFLPYTMISEIIKQNFQFDD